jgi:hypothetical protein
MSDKQYFIDYYQNNKEALKEKAAKRYKEKREEIRAYVAEYKKRNAGRVNEMKRRREASKRQATPVWADVSEMRYVYSVAREKNLAVDHIVPLNSSKVCGLHCPDNLRCIPKRLNSFKKNRYWIDMWTPFFKQQDFKIGKGGNTDG